VIDGAARDAGIRRGDIVLMFDGNEVLSARHLRELIDAARDKRTVAVLVRRGDSPMFMALAWATERLTAVRVSTTVTAAISARRWQPLLYRLAGGGGRVEWRKVDERTEWRTCYGDRVPVLHDPGVICEGLGDKDLMRPVFQRLTPSG
jgi:hypothetical protein